MMKPRLSNKSVMFRKNISPVRQIMSYASPAYFHKIGLDQAKLISFAGGWVNHQAPEELKEAYLEIIKNNKLFHQSGGYSSTLGMNECKEALARYEKHIYDLDIDAKQIAIGANSTQLTTDLLHILLDSGDKILLLDPTYCNFPTQIVSALNAEIIYFKVVDENTWEYNADKKKDEFAQFILKEKPKVVLLVSPDNPTSQILSSDFVKMAMDAVQEIGGFLVIDFAYKDIIFNEISEYYSWSPNPNLISIHSNSKWSRSLGRRLGWVEADEEVINHLESIQSSSILCPDTLHQMALTGYINRAVDENKLKSYLLEVSRQYKKAAEQTVISVKKHLGLPCFAPQGGLYTCIKIGRDGARFVEEVLKDTGVLFVPGWGFGRSLHNAIRVSYGPLVNDLHLIDEGMERVGEFIKKTER